MATPLQNLEALPQLKELLILHGLWAKKSLGQNFLLDQNITDRIAKQAHVGGATVLEVGPGPGGLTRSLLRAGAYHVFALEKDKRCCDLLESLVEASHGSFTLISVDALKLKLSKFREEYQFSAPLHIVANLPYNIGTQLLLNWFSELEHVASMTLMFQKEVAERLVAHPKTKSFGRLSLIAQYLCNVKIILHLPPSAFVPVPKVTSSVVQFTPKSMTQTEKELVPALETITAHAFGQRRKMLKSSLKSILSEACIRACGIDPSTRPEDLSLDAFILLARSLQNCAESHS